MLQAQWPPEHVRMVSAIFKWSYSIKTLLHPIPSDLAGQYEKLNQRKLPGENPRSDAFVGTIDEEVQAGEVGPHKGNHVDDSL